MGRLDFGVEAPTAVFREQETNNYSVSIGTTSTTSSHKVDRGIRSRALLPIGLALRQYGLRGWQVPPHRALFKGFEQIAYFLMAAQRICYGQKVCGITDYPRSNFSTNNMHAANAPTPNMTPSQKLTSSGLRD